MSKGRLVYLKPWALPVLAIGITVPIIAAFALGGPAAGLAAGALMMAGLIVAAVRMRPDEAIEVATRGDDCYRILVLAVEAIESPRAVETIADSVQSATASWETPDEAVEVLVVAPAFNRRLAHWLSDVGEARLGAQRRLALSLAGLAAANVDARGLVGDADALQALEDTLRSFPADEVFLVAGTPGRGRAAHLLASDVRGRLEVPIRQIAGADAGPATPAEIRLSRRR